MKRSFIALASVFLQFIVTLGSTVPAFVWSPHVDMSQAVHYQTVSPKDLPKSIFSEGGWSDLLFSSINRCCTCFCW